MARSVLLQSMLPPPVFLVGPMIALALLLGLLVAALLLLRRARRKGRQSQA